MLSKLQPNRGDTIVEVMIVLAVLGLAIGISYATANRSLLNARQAQENSIATEIAQSQIEALVSLTCASDYATCPNPNTVGSSTYPLFHDPFPYCIVNGTLQASSNSACTLNGLYNIQITYHDKTSVAQPNTFEVEILWNDVLGQGTDTVRLDYTVPS